MSFRSFVSPVIILVTAAVLCGCAAVPSETAKNPTDGGNVKPVVQVARVTSQHLNRSIRLPGELSAYQDVALFAKIQGFVQEIHVDRGSSVKRGQLLARLIAPELTAQRNAGQARALAEKAQLREAEAKLQSVRAQLVEAQARVSAEDATYRRLKAAAETPGVVSGNELELAQKAAEAGQSRVHATMENEKAAEAHVGALQENERAAREAARSIAELESYLQISAPFDGIITERNVHQGSLVGPAAGPTTPPILRIQQVARLRLTVFVPEAEAGAVIRNEEVPFSLPAFPGEVFKGNVQRVAHALDAKTRSMPVELDVTNPTGRLAPGMYAEVTWPTRRPTTSLFVPPSAIAVTTERTFVVRIQNDAVEWVDVKRGGTMGALVEVFGNLNSGDLVAVRASDELRSGTQVQAQTVSENQR